VPRTELVREAERDLEIFSLLVVPLNVPARLDTAVLRMEAARLLRVPRFKLEVFRQKGSTFLLRFEEKHERDSGLRLGFLEFGYFRFCLMPWTHHVCASSVSRLLYHVRLCIEGVPAHLRHAGALVNLFSPSTFIDDEVCKMEKPEDEECARVWLWTSTPDDIAITGTLLAEEPVVLPVEHFADAGAHLVEPGMPYGALRVDAAQALDYDVIIHVDRVIDYTPLPDSPQHRSMDSDTSGLPDEELEEEWPVKHSFVWRLGEPDRRPVPERRRVPVHERLGGRGRDRSPPRGGGTRGAGPAGRGYMQMPPSGMHDVPGLLDRGGGGGVVGGGGCRHGGGGRQFQRRNSGSAFDRLGRVPACVPLGNVFDRLEGTRRSGGVFEGSGGQTAAAIDNGGVLGLARRPARLSGRRTVLLLATGCGGPRVMLRVSSS
jgi:hypothetical protein